MVYGTDEEIVIDENEFFEPERLLSDKNMCCCCFFCLPCKQPYVIGSGILLYGKPVASRFPTHCLLGPDWGCVLATLGILIGGSVSWLIYVAFDLHRAVGILGSINALTTITFYSLTAFSDPGIVPKSHLLLAAPPDGFSVACTRCNVYRAAGTVHCHVCDVCIEHLDHHCPWTGKCIGTSTNQSGK